MSQVTWWELFRVYREDCSERAEHSAHEEESSDDVDLCGLIVRIGFDIEVRDGKAHSDVEG